MPRNERERTQREDVALGAGAVEPARLQSTRRFYTAQGNDRATREARALSQAFAAGTELFGAIQEKRNVEGARLAASQQATGEDRDPTNKNKGYVEAWDKLDAEADVNEIKKELPEILRGANWEELTEQEVQDLIDGYMREKFQGINPQSAYAEIWTPGALAINRELLAVHRDMQIQNIQTEQAQTIYSNTQARYEASAEKDKNGEPIPGTEKFDYDYVADQTRIFFDGKEKRERNKEIIFDFAIQNGRPDIIENAPDRFASGDPTGIREDVDAYREALLAARAMQAKQIAASVKAQQDEQDAYNESLKWTIYNKHAAGQDISKEMALFRARAEDGLADFGDYSEVKNFTDGQLAEFEEQSPNYPYASALWTDIYNGVAGYSHVYQARQNGELGHGKTADDLMQRMMSTIERMTPSGDQARSAEVSAYRKQITDAFNPQLGGMFAKMDMTRYHVRNQALADYNDRVLEQGEAPVEAMRAVIDKYNSLLEGLDATGLTADKMASMTSSQFAGQFVFTPDTIGQIVSGDIDFADAISGVPTFVWQTQLMQAIDEGIVSEAQVNAWAEGHTR